MAKGRAHINVLIAWAMAKSHVLSIGQHLADFKSRMAEVTRSISWQHRDKHGTGSMKCMKGVPRLRYL